MIKKIIKYVSFFFLLILNIVLDLNIDNYILVLEKCFNKNIILPIKFYVLISIILALISILAYLVVLLLFLKIRPLKMA